MSDVLCPVLLVDDDPIMLSGVKLLIDWRKNGFLPPETASGGREALEKLYALQPGIVICDIVMPGFSGLDLLKQAEEQYPCTVFIMLSNYEEFDLARQSMRHRALEYLIKSGLEPDMLETTLQKAKLERENRKRLYQSKEAENCLEPVLRQGKIYEAARRFFLQGADLPHEDKILLTEEGMLKKCGFALILLNLAVLPKYPEITREERRNILDWEIDIARRLAVSFFPYVLLFPYSEGTEGGAADETESLLLFAWNLTRENWEPGMEQFRKSLMKTSAQITRLGTDTLVSAFYEDAIPDSPPEILYFMAEKYHIRGKHFNALQKAQQYILENIDKTIMINDVADYVCISPGYLSTLFKKECKTSLVDFINHVKIERACFFLRENRIRIKEIAFQLGYGNAMYFSKVFYRYIGMTPSEYQEKHIRDKYPVFSP